MSQRSFHASSYYASRRVICWLLVIVIIVILGAHANYLMPRQDRSILKMGKAPRPAPVTAKMTTPSHGVHGSQVNKKCRPPCVCVLCQSQGHPRRHCSITHSKLSPDTY